MNWIAILELVMTMLGECQQSRPRTEVLGDIKSPGPFARIALRIKLRGQGLNREEVQQAMAIIEANTAATDEEAKEILDVAEEMPARQQTLPVDEAARGPTLPSIAGLLIAVSMLLFAPTAIAAEGFAAMVAAPAVADTKPALDPAEFACDCGCAEQLAELRSRIEALERLHKPSPAKASAPTPASSPKPIEPKVPARQEKSVLTGHWETRCFGGSCQRVWVPAGTTYQYRTYSTGRSRRR